MNQSAKKEIVNNLKRALGLVQWTDYIIPVDKSVGIDVDKYKLTGIYYKTNIDMLFVQINGKLFPLSGCPIIYAQLVTLYLQKEGNVCMRLYDQLMN